jgi:hypothetical protein
MGTVVCGVTVPDPCDHTRQQGAPGMQVDVLATFSLGQRGCLTGGNAAIDGHEELPG